ncbi:hypothetical protein ACWEIJ_23555 [Lentzea sp. NPDC004789]
MTSPDLLLLRLDALEFDIEKVRSAVESAESRGRFLMDAAQQIQPCKGQLRALKRRLTALFDAMDDDPRISALLDEAESGLDKQLCAAPALVDELKQSVDFAANCLLQAAEMVVQLDDNANSLRQSLDHRCNEVLETLETLRNTVRATGADRRMGQWEEYDQLLRDMAEPVFAEYVDFLGGLTVRDTGLDDRICEMTDALLTRRFKSVTTRTLPLPARRAALGRALDTVVLLGFPEWSVWGIPLVGHEVGLAYARAEEDNYLAQLITKYAEPAKPGGPTKPYLVQLLADVFAAYTLGLAYGCAALLLRLGPRYNEQPSRDMPRDIDRARVIMMTLLHQGPNAPVAGGSFSDTVGILEGIWTEGVRAYAGPAQAQNAADEAAGPPEHLDWLDDFTGDAIEAFSSLRTIRAYDNERWTASQQWYDALKSRQRAEPSWNPPENAVPDVLTAAWRLRLCDHVNPTELAADIKDRWSRRKKVS